MKYDLIIKNANIADGTGNDLFSGSVAVKDGHIVEIYTIEEPSAEELSLAEEVIDAQGLILAPGFIDIHSHSDATILDVPEADSRVLQGVTTEIGGNCGLSAAPLNPIFKKDHIFYMGYDAENDPVKWISMGDYLKCVEETSPSVNIGCLTGHGTLRIAAMGFSDAVPTEEQMAVMKKYLIESLEDGSFGMSSGLIYPPGSFAQPPELTELAKELVPYKALYATHMRDEGNELISSVEETIKLAEDSGAFVEISHHKETRKALWQDAVLKTVAMMKDARQRGVRIAFDQYPYRASSTGLDSNIPLWAFEGGQEKLFERLRDPDIKAQLAEESNAGHVGRWGDIYVAYAQGEENQWLIGKNIEEIAQITGKDPAYACFDIVLSSEGHATEVNYGMCEEDIEFIMSQDFGVIGSDGEAMSLDHDGIPHPRHFGTFPRVIAHYCRDRKLFGLETAISKMTGKPAERLGLRDRGLIKKGMWADLVLFDFETIKDTPTYAAPKAACEGIRRVYVNGVLTVLDGVHTGARAGKVLRHERD